MESPDPLALLLSLADLLALMTGIGILSCRLWMFPGIGKAAKASPDAWLVAFWRLLGLCLAVLTATSIGLLIQRSLAMSGQPLAELGTVLPTVWRQTHFGHVWLLRALALALLWLSWAVSSRLRSTASAALILCAAVAIVASRSLTGHAADWGVWALPVWADGVHLLAASAWGGALLALALTGCRALTARNEARAAVVASIGRLSSLCGVALAVLVVSGIYSAWLEVGSLPALWHTAYGRVLLGKLGLALGIALLGAANRYIGIPRLQRWAGDSVGGPVRWHSLASSPLGRLADWLSRDIPEPLARFRRLMAIETVLIAGLAICVAVLVNLTPARHLRHAGGAMHGHHGSGQSEPSGHGSHSGQALPADRQTASADERPVTEGWTTDHSSATD
jgi:putative copper export protein